jgi:hypothetical protein
LGLLTTIEYNRSRLQMLQFSGREIALGLKLAPIDAAVVGIIDGVELASEDSGPARAVAPAKKQPKKQQAQ